MAHRPFASAPYVVGKSAPAPAEQHIPAEESLCPVVSHDWVNSEYKHLVVDASPKALAVKPGQFFNLLCPSPDAGELWLRRPQSVYRIDRAEPPHRVSLQMRRPRHLRPCDAGSRRRAQHGRTARGRIYDRSSLQAHRGPRARRRACHLGADLAARRRIRHRRHCDPERAQRRIRDGRRPLRQGWRGHRRPRQRRRRARSSTSRQFSNA